MNLLLEKNVLTEAHKADCRKDYVTILRRSDHPLPGDAERLVEVMDVLQITDADVQADAEVLRTDAELSAAVKSSDEVEADLEEYRQADIQAAEAAKVTLVEMVKTFPANPEYIRMYLNESFQWFKHAPAKREAVEAAVQHFQNTSRSLAQAQRVSDPSGIEALRTHRKSHPRLFQDS